MLVLLIAAIRVKKEKNCTGYSIDITGSGNQVFIDKIDIENQLTNQGAFQLKGRPLKSFDLEKMEEKLRHNSWIIDAELFFDNKQLLSVKIKERQPIARIITSTGNSFYIDSTMKQLPLSEKIAARLPVFTGFPSDRKIWSKEDSLLMMHIKSMSSYIRSHPFWMAQVSQIDITPSRSFEIVPTIGDHIIEFGVGINCEKKFNRLLLFYQQVISKIGFATYERIKVQFDGQIVGVRHSAAISKYDSLQAIKNVEKLIALAQTEQDRIIKMDSVDLERMEYATDKDVSPEKIYNSLTEKPSIDSLKRISEKSKIAKNPTLKSLLPYESVKNSKPVKNQPKAVMKKNNKTN